MQILEAIRSFFVPPADPAEGDGLADYRMHDVTTSLGYEVNDLPDPTDEELDQWFSDVVT